ncbi:uncharacterized protein LOC130899341 [Diorhabda carinulata]|uniref:uncharacterized protein LOC130899341 n=1 Tax=Diorhabda carinulata TaxID=1163345 RepID=UPI0025A1FB33|nr:uncharacterized protein LOC130899341 [Diorhabda carinulata]XP_057665208.1 uncharacterized protein LOC130899341 [Diorhabda carinulata]XP_057665209.1 uncharacterized protein LOC130899341 [Diorhabda carinulata]
MDDCLEEIIEIKEESLEDNVEIDDVFEEDYQPVTVLHPKQTNTVNLPFNNFKQKPIISQTKPQILQPKPSVTLPEIKCMVEGCPTKGRSADLNYFCLTEQRFDSWLKALEEDPSTIKLDPAIPYKYLVCQRHFRQCDFRGRLQKINDDAVPSLNIPGKAAIVKVAPHEISIIEDILELDEQSQGVCFTVYKKLEPTDIPPGKNKLQQSALLCGISYHTMKKIIKSREEGKTKKKSLVTAILQIEKLSGRVVPTLDFYYKQLRSNYPGIRCSKKELLHWLKVIGVTFKKNAAETVSGKKDTIIILSDDEVETVENSNLDLISTEPSIGREVEVNATEKIEESEIEKLIVDEDILEQEKNVQPLFVTVKEANLLNVLSEIYEPFKIEGNIPSLDYYYVKVLEKTNEFFSKDTLKHWLEQLDIKYKENENVETKLKEEIETPIEKHPKIELDVSESLIEPKKEPETDENMEIENLIVDQETLDQEKNVLPLFITIKEVNLLHLLPKIYEPFRFEDKIPSLKYYNATVSEITKEVFNKETVKTWLDQLNIKYEDEQVQTNEMPLAAKSAIHTIYNFFYKKNVQTNLPSLERIYDNLQKLVGRDGLKFSKETLVRWLQSLSLKFKINQEIISPPSLAYFESQLILREHHYSKETLSTWLKHLKIHFKEEDSIETLEEPKYLSAELQNLLVQSNKEFYKASSTSGVDSTIVQLLTDIESSFHNLNMTATVDNYYQRLISDAGITCSKNNLIKWLNILGIEYSWNDKNCLKPLDNKPTLDYFFTMLSRTFAKQYTKENIRYWLNLLKIEFKEEPTLLPIEHHAAILPSYVASKLKTINREFYSNNKQPCLDNESIGIINSIVEKSGVQTPSLQHIYEELKNKYITKGTLKDYLTSNNIRFTMKNYQYSSLVCDITTAIKNKCRIPNLDYFYVNITSSTNITCSRKQLQKWLDSIGILYYPSTIEDGQFVTNEVDLTPQMTSYLLKLDRDYIQSSSVCITNILRCISNKFIEKGETPTLNFIYNYLQSYRLFFNENPSYYSKDVLRHWLNVLKIEFCDDNSTCAEQSNTSIPTLKEFHEKYTELTGNTCQENQIAVWLNTLGVKFKTNSQNVSKATTPYVELTEKIADVLKRAKREILLNNLKFQLKGIEWSFMLQNQKPEYSHLVRIIESFNVFDQFKCPIKRKKVYKEWLQEMGIQYHDDKEKTVIDTTSKITGIPTEITIPSMLDSPQENVFKNPDILLVKWSDLPKITLPSTTNFPEIVISDVRSLNSSCNSPIIEQPNSVPLNVTSQNNSENIIASTSKETLPETQESFKPRTNFVDESFFRNIELEFSSKGKTPSLEYIQYVLKENGLCFGESTLKKLLNSMDIKFIDEKTNVDSRSNITVKKEIEEYSVKRPEDNWKSQYTNVELNTETTTVENESIVDKSINDMDISGTNETTNKKRKGEIDILNPKKAKVNPKHINKGKKQLKTTPANNLNSLAEDLNNVININEVDESIEISKHNSKSEQDVNIEKTKETKQEKERPIVKVVDINKLVENPIDHEKIIKSPRKPNQSYSKSKDVNNSDLVVSIFTDVEHEFYQNRKTPVLDDFYLRVLEKCGSQYDREAIKKWLRKIGIKFKDK